VLRALYLFRDNAARKLDAPPFKVINNSVLADLARKPPASAQELFKRQGVSFRVARRFGAEIIDIIAGASKDDPAILDRPPRPAIKPPGRAAQHSLEMLKKWRQGKSEDLKLPVGVIFPSNLLENLAAAPPVNMDEFTTFPGMRRWRVHEFGREVLETLHGAIG
jgi:ribonuclease D